MPISAFAPKSGHTSCYIRKQITIDISRDLPTFHRPSMGTQIVTFLGISLLLPTFHRHTNDDIPSDIPTFSLLFNWHTINDIPWDIPIFRPQQRGYFLLHFFNILNKKISSDLRSISNRSHAYIFQNYFLYAPNS